MKKPRYQNFLFIALLFLQPKLYSEESQEDSQDLSANKKDTLQYNDMPLLPIDEIKGSQSATEHEPFKKLRYRSPAIEDLDAQSKNRTRQR